MIWAGRLIIGGILADASAVGNGEDITVTVMVSGVEALAVRLSSRT